MEELNITLTLDEVNFVLNVLSEQPYKNVNVVFNKIGRQAEAQVSAIQAKTKNEKQA